MPSHLIVMTACENCLGLSLLSLFSSWGKSDAKELNVSLTITSIARPRGTSMWPSRWTLGSCHTANPHLSSRLRCASTGICGPSVFSPYVSTLHSLCQGPLWTFVTIPSFLIPSTPLSLSPSNLLVWQNLYWGHIQLSLSSAPVRLLEAGDKHHHLEWFRFEVMTTNQSQSRACPALPGSGTCFPECIHSLTPLRWLSFFSLNPEFIFLHSPCFPFHWENKGSQRKAWLSSHRHL